MRLALALLFVTGIRISELLPLKMNQVESLFTNHWISIDRAKSGPANHKAFLTKEGSDFELLQLFKKSDSYIFTAENSQKPLAGRNPNLSSHSFRIGYISQLWKDTKDIEFVRQTIGHRSLNATSGYGR